MLVTFFISTMIQSISDIITNSSSEVFIIKSQKERNQEIMELIMGFYKLIGRNIDNDLEMFVASEKFHDKDWGYKYKKGDIVIYSNDDNSIPYAVMVFIEELPSLLDYLHYGDVTRCHLG